MKKLLIPFLSVLFMISPSIFFLSCNTNNMVEESRYYMSKKNKVTILAVRNVGMKMPAQDVYVFNGVESQWYSIPFDEIDKYKVGDTMPALVLREYIYVTDTTNRCSGN